MGLLEQFKAFLTREGAAAKEWVDEVLADGDSALDQAERRQSANPDERLEANLEDIRSGDEAFDAIRARAEGSPGPDPIPDEDTHA